MTVDKPGNTEVAYFPETSESRDGIYHFRYEMFRKSKFRWVFDYVFRAIFVQSSNVSGVREGVSGI